MNTIHKAGFVEMVVFGLGIENKIFVLSEMPVLSTAYYISDFLLNIESYANIIIYV